MDEVLEPAFATLVNLQVQDFQDLVLWFSIENNLLGPGMDSELRVLAWRHGRPGGSRTCSWANRG